MSILDRSHHVAVHETGPDSPDELLHYVEPHYSLLKHSQPVDTNHRSSPAELYSYYGLAIRRDSPLPDTLVAGCADGSIGYLPDPEAYRLGTLPLHRRAFA